MFRQINGRRWTVALALIVFATATSAFAQTSVFTYQRRLSDGGAPANGSYDLQFALFDSAGGGAQIGSPQTGRNPNDAPGADYTGYDFWLSKLNQFDGDYGKAEMVKAFIVSAEYRQRFGP